METCILVRHHLTGVRVFHNARFDHQTVIPIDRKWRESCVIVDKTKKQFFSALIFFFFFFTHSMHFGEDLLIE